MTDHDLADLLGEPRPDEDAWEAFLNLALERVGGERGPGLTNHQIGELEEVVGCQLPFEVGLILVMGVPVADGWHQWAEPQAEFAAWNERVVSGLCFDIEHNEFWFDDWGTKPDALTSQLEIARHQFESNVPRLFPLYGHRAMPLTAADGQANSDGNPVLSVQQSDVVLYGDDLAAWMHREFEVPLPMWPVEERQFQFWTPLMG